MDNRPRFAAKPAANEGDPLSRWEIVVAQSRSHERSLPIAGASANAVFWLALSTGSGALSMRQSIHYPGQHVHANLCRGVTQLRFCVALIFPIT
jgi:hypothetical protein